MDVKCERCNTEYEFDDALVSGRGTTVKCTNCGHKFKIRRSDGDFSEDFWNVTTGDGRTLVFTSLRELQRAIQSYLVERNDRLSRGGLPPKAIGQIPELTPFFEQREAAKKSQQSGRTVKTQDGLGPAAQALVSGHNEARPRQPTKPEFPAPPANDDSVLEKAKSTLIGTGPLSEQEAFPISAPEPVSRGPEPARRVPSVPPPPTVREPEPSFEPVPLASAPPLVASAPPAPVLTPPPRPVAKVAPPVPKRDTVPLKRPTPTPPPMPVAARATPTPPPGGSSPPPLPARARRPSETAPIVASASDPPPRAAAPRERRDEAVRDSSEPRAARVVDAANGTSDVSSPLPPRRVRSLLAEIEDARDRRGEPPSLPEGPPSRRRSTGGFIIAAVVVAGLMMLGAVWAKNNLGVTLGTKAPPAPAPTVDPRVGSFLANGERALADGNVELAKESFDKASALSEKDAHVLLGLARLAAIRADVLWLKSRLLPLDATDEHRITRDSLSELAAGARRAAEDALILAPDDPAALRAKIDALRISGDREGARALVGRIAPNASQPESAYVLAALDLAETEPLWPTVIERLRVASSAETGPGRARAALVFALARSGDFASAKAEVDRLTALPRAHPLLPLLRGFVDKSKSKTDAGAPLAGLEADAGPPARGVRAAGVPGGGSGLSSDARDLVTQGEKARAKGDYDRAKTLFSAAVEKNPNDSEALAGLGAIAHAQRDMNGARTSYKRVLAINPNYMPALVGLADVEWESGDKATATRMYKDIVDRYPEGAYPGRIKQRAEGGG